MAILRQTFLLALNLKQICFLNFLSFLYVLQADYFLEFQPIWVYLGCFVSEVRFVFFLFFVVLFLCLFLFVWLFCLFACFGFWRVFLFFQVVVRGDDFSFFRFVFVWFGVFFLVCILF